MKKLKTMGESGVERVGEGLESVGFLVCGGAAGGGADICGAMVVKVSSGWICGAVERVRG